MLSLAPYFEAAETGDFSSSNSPKPSPVLRYWVNTVMAEMKKQKAKLGFDQEQEALAANPPSPVVNVVEVSSLDPS